MLYGKAYDRLPDDKKLAVWYKELEQDMERWRFIKENGCNDPCWPDGVNLNLKRNHIIYDLRHIAELEKKPKQITFSELLSGVTNSTIVDENDPRIPQKVPDDFMAKPRRCTYFDRNS